jgi:signal transduction histidine kinase
LTKNNRHGVLLVKDTGIGISKEDVLHIFDRFYRADDARARASTNGYGLGLAIAKKLIDEVKGKIKVTSESGKGTTFVVQIPLFFERSKKN